MVAIRAMDSTTEPLAKVLYSLANSATKDAGISKRYLEAIPPLNDLVVYLSEGLAKAGRVQLTPKYVRSSQMSERGQARYWW